MAQQKGNRTLSFPVIVGYGTGGMFALLMSASFISYMLMPFLTQSAGFSTVVAATIYSSANIVKLVSMLISGIIIDGISMKWGKYRSWVLIGGLILMVSTGLCFTNFGLNEGLYAIVFLVLFFINQTGYNVAWTGGRALVGPMSKTSADAMMLTSAAQIGSSAAGTVYGLISAAILAIFVSSTSPYAGPGWIYGAMSALGCLLLFVIAKPYDKPQAAAAETKSAKKKGVGLGEMLRSLKGQGLLFFIGTTFGNIQTGFFATLLYYFSTFVLKDPETMGLAVTFNSIGGLIGAFLAPALSKKMSKKNMYIWAHYGSAALYVALFLVGTAKVPFLILRFLIGFVGTFAGVTLPALGNDLADYNEMKGESRARAFVQSMIGTSIRVGTLISGAVASYGLAAVGFVAGVEPTQSVQTGIAALMGIAPAVVCVVAAVIIGFFKVDEAELDAYRAQKSQAAQ